MSPPQAHGTSVHRRVDGRQLAWSLAVTARALLVVFLLLSRTAPAQAQQADASTAGSDTSPHITLKTAAGFIPEGATGALTVDQPFWIELRLPAEACPGTRKDSVEVTLSTAGGSSTTITLSDHGGRSPILYSTYEPLTVAHGGTADGGSAAFAGTFAFRFRGFNVQSGEQMTASFGNRKVSARVFDNVSKLLVADYERLLEVQHARIQRGLAQPGLSAEDAALLRARRHLLDQAREVMQDTATYTDLERAAIGSRLVDAAVAAPLTNDPRDILVLGVNAVESGHEEAKAMLWDAATRGWLRITEGLVRTVGAVTGVGSAWVAVAGYDPYTLEKKDVTDRVLAGVEVASQLALIVAGTLWNLENIPRGDVPSVTDTTRIRPLAGETTTAGGDPAAPTVRTTAGDAPQISSPSQPYAGQLLPEAARAQLRADMDAADLADSVLTHQSTIELARRAGVDVDAIAREHGLDLSTSPERQFDGADGAEAQHALAEQVRAVAYDAMGARFTSGEFELVDVAADVIWDQDLQSFRAVADDDLVLIQSATVQERAATADVQMRSTEGYRATQARLQGRWQEEGFRDLVRRGAYFEADGDEARLVRVATVEDQALLDQMRLGQETLTGEPGTGPGLSCGLPPIYPGLPAGLYSRHSSDGYNAVSDPRACQPTDAAASHLGFFFTPARWTLAAEGPRLTVKLPGGGAGEPDQAIGVIASDGSFDVTGAGPRTTLRVIGRLAGQNDTTRGAATVTNTAGLCTWTYHVDLWAPDSPRPLQVITEGLPPATAGRSYSRQLQAFGGVEPYTWTFAERPSLQLTLEDRSGTLSFTPSPADVRERDAVNVVVRVTDAQGQSDVRSYSVALQAADASR